MKQTPKQIKAEERQMMLAFVLIIAVLLSFHVFMPRQTSSTAELQQETVEENLTQHVNNNVLQQQIMSTIPHTTNVEVQNDFVIGSLGMNGGIFNKLDLEKYKQTVEKDSPDISLLSNNYFAYLKWN